VNVRTLTSLIFCMAALVVWLFHLPACLADEMLNDLEQGLAQQKDQEDKAFCDRGIYSKSFDRWVKDYVNGRSAEAEKDWAGVIQATRGAKSFRQLASGIYTRLEFVEGEDSRKLEKLGGPLAGIRAIFALTEKQMGQCEQTASVADYISNQYKNSSNYPESKRWYLKVLEIRERVFGKNDLRIAGALIEVADNEILTHEYASAKAHAERALAIATSERAPHCQIQARVLLKRLSKIPAANKPRP
jgi:Tetratricopeptide repeat